MDVTAMREDMSEELQGSAFGTQFQKAPIPIYIAVTPLVMLGVPVMSKLLLNS